MTRRLLKCALVAALALPGSHAVAQCGGGSGGGGHDHGQSAPTRSERKADRMIHELMSEEGNRALLMDALLSDPEFMRALVDRVAETPEWRALAAERIGMSPQPPATSEDGGPGKSDQVIYICPMHPEVTSGKPGKCSKCGMSLRARQSEGSP